MDAAAGFDFAYKAIAYSKVYAQAVHAVIGDLPEWLVPYSVTSLSDLQRVACETGIGLGDTLLDLACGLGGPGLWIAERTGASLVGVDFSPAAIESAQHLSARRGLDGRAQFLVADAANTGLPAGSADALMCLDALPFIDAAAAAHEVSRLLRPGGIAVIRTWEALTGDVPLPAIVKDYTPVFASAGLTLRAREELADLRERELAFYRAIAEHAPALTAEIGAGAEPLLEEARHMLARADQPPRVRKMLYVLECSSGLSRR